MLVQKSWKISKTQGQANSFLTLTKIKFNWANIELCRSAAITTITDGMSKCLVPTWRSLIICILDLPLLSPSGSTTSSCESYVFPPTPRATPPDHQAGHPSSEQADFLPSSGSPSAVLLHGCRQCAKSFKNSRHLDDHVKHCHSDHRPFRYDLSSEKKGIFLLKNIHSLSCNTVEIGGLGHMHYPCFETHFSWII